MGKSETALEVAKVFNAEIINGDAFQSYKEMEIGVAKPPKAYFEEVPHHLFSCVNVDEEYSIADYQIKLRNAINEVLSKGKNVVIVGGSGLYIRAALYDYVFSEQAKIDLSKYEKMTNAELLSQTFMFGWAGAEPSQLLCDWVDRGLGSVKVRKGDYVVSGDEVGTAGVDPIKNEPQITFMVFQNGTALDPAKAPRG